MSSVPPPPIAGHRLIGNGASSALVRPGGEVDWWCAPRLDSPPLLWSLLDSDGSAARWCDTRFVSAPPSPAGPTAATVLRAPGGRFDCLDGLMATPAGVQALVRLVRAVDDDFDLVHELGLGGFDQSRAAWNGRVGTLGGHEAYLLGGELAGVDEDTGTILARVTVRRDRWSALVVSLDGTTPDDGEELKALLAESQADHDRVVDGARLPHHHPERVRDAISVLRCCTFAETGAVVAAVTTSLPEAPGHDRQFDYRFTWLRDASLAASVAALLGQLEVARQYLAFAERQVEDGAELASLRTVDGGPVPAERDVPGVAGWAGSTPVRVGNGAAGQTQLDAWGLVVEAVSVYLQNGGVLEEATWRLVCRLADDAADFMPGTATHGIWELRQPLDLVSADVGRWLTLDRAIWISRGWRPLARRGRWKR
ncbi:MAG: glycoside hydrolase family 15 protein, partial [Acidimicrobiales bacterium]